MDSEVEIRAWLGRNNEPNLAPEELDHVAMCMDHIRAWYYQDRPIGHFLTAVVRNDLCEACFKADSTNLKALKMYALFLHNHLPADWRKKGV